MLKDEILKWMSNNSKSERLKYESLNDEKKKKEILKRVFKRIIENNPDYIIGLHPQILKKFGVKAVRKNIEKKTEEFEKNINGKYLYTLID